MSSEEKLLEVAKKIAEIYEDRGEFSTQPLDEDAYTDLPSEEALLMEELIEVLEEYE